MKLCVIGTGYVGLVDGACFAETGNSVVCVDNDQVKIDRLKQGIIPIYEPGLDVIVWRNVDAGRLSFSTDIAQAVRDADICFISVGTPPQEDGSADLQHVVAVAESIGKALNGYKLIVDKSTVPVGTADVVTKTIKNLTEQPFDVASNPEFLKEGAAVDDFLHPDRIVVGANSERALELLRQLYAPFTQEGAQLIEMDVRSAEMTKYAANAMLATRISFMNDVANLCELVGADVDMVRRGIGSDKRIGSLFLNPGPGYGGSCFPKDVKALIKTAKDNNYHMRVLQAVEEVNAEQKKVMGVKVLKHFNNDLKNKTIAIWGLAFKAKTDDMREASSIEVINILLTAGAHVKVHDPEAIENTKKIFHDQIEYCYDNYHTIEDADALVIMTEWNDYKEPDFEMIKSKLKQPIIFDGRNLYDRKRLNKLGFTYYGIGR